MSRRRAIAISIIFLLSAIVLDMWGDTNIRSRMALLSAIKEDKRFQIDPYREWTIDWAHPPNGHYYSNKAPGPVLVALPLYWVLDEWWTGSVQSRILRDAIRLKRAELASQILSVLLQALPFIGLFFWSLRILEPMRLSANAMRFFSFAYLFGTTAALYMNTFFGHGLAAVFCLALLLSLLSGRNHLAGTFFGWGVLSDYGSLLLLPGAVILLMGSEKAGRLKRLFQFVTGGILPGVLWAFYHWTCFGGILALPNRFQNPLFVEGGDSLWGIFASYPRPSALFELLLGPTRGIAFTQPWLLLSLGAIPWLIRQRPPIRQVAAFSAMGLFLLLLMNASFITWHAGGAPGPRYLSAILPCFSILGAKLYDRSQLWGRLLRAGLIVTLSFNALVFASHGFHNPEFGLVWKHFFTRVFFSGGPMPAMRLMLFGVLLAFGYLLTIIKARRR